MATNKPRKAFSTATTDRADTHEISERLRQRVKELQDRADAEKERISAAQAERRIDDIEKYVAAVLRGEPELKHSPPAHDDSRPFTPSLFARAEDLRRTANREEFNVVNLRLEKDLQNLLTSYGNQHEASRDIDARSTAESTSNSARDFLREFSRSAGQEKERDNGRER